MRPKSLSHLYELRKLNENTLPSICFLKYNTQLKSLDNSVKQGSIILKVWRNSVELKRTKAYSKAVFLIISSSLAFLLLHTPMIVSKAYHLVCAVTQNQSQLNNNANEDYSNANDSEFLVEIGDKISCYLYYLNFACNMFFYSIREPRRSLRKNKNSLSKFTLKKLTSSEFFKKHGTI